MPQRSRPSKHTRSLLSAQRLMYQDQTSNLMMYTATCLAHAARVMKPMNEDDLVKAVEAQEERKEEAETNQAAASAEVPMDALLRHGGRDPDKPQQ